MLQAREDGECGSTIADLLLPGRVSDVTKVPKVALGVSLGERLFSDDIQFSPLGDETDRAPPT